MQIVHAMWATHFCTIKQQKQNGQATGSVCCELIWCAMCTVHCAVLAYVSMYACNHLARVAKLVMPVASYVCFFLLFIHHRRPCVVGCIVHFSYMCINIYAWLKADGVNEFNIKYCFCSWSPHEFSHANQLLPFLHSFSHPEFDWNIIFVSPKFHLLLFFFNVCFSHY